MCVPLDSSLDVFCVRCANSAVSESWSGFLPKRHTKWPFLATVSLATLHLHLSLLSNKVMHNSIPKWPLFDHLDHKMIGFPICKCLALRIPFGCPYGFPFQRTYTIDRIPYNIRSFLYHPHDRSHAMHGMHAHAMLVMHKNAQNEFDAKYGYATLFIYTF